MECKDVCKCLFNVTHDEFHLYELLIKNPVRIDDILEIVPKDRSTIQKKLTKLVKCGIVQREKCSIKNGGGHYYTYKSVPPNILVPYLNKCLNNWHKDMKDALNSLKNLE